MQSDSKDNFDPRLPNLIKVSTLQPDINNKGRIGAMLAIGLLIFIVFVFIIANVFGAFLTTGDFGTVLGICSLAPIALGTFLTVRGIIIFKAQPSRCVNVEATIVRIEKTLDNNQHALFVPILNYIHNGQMIENSCPDLAHTVPDYRAGTKIIVPIDASNPRLFWIHSKPLPVVPKMIYIGTAILAIGLAMLITPLFIHV